MTHAAVTSDGLSLKQEAFAQAVAAGSSLFDAYMASFNRAPGSNPNTVYPDASALAAQPKIRLRIKTLTDAASKLALQHVAWDKVRLVNEAAENLQIARTGGWRGIGSANGALELIGRATGLLSDKAQPPGGMVTVTEVRIIMDAGAGSKPRVVEARVEPGRDTAAVTGGAGVEAQEQTPGLSQDETGPEPHDGS